ILGGLAEFERELIKARTDDGRKRAMAPGKRFGRKPKLTPHQIAEALRRRDAGEALTEIAKTFNVSHSTISRLPYVARPSSPGRSRRASPGARSRQPTCLHQPHARAAAPTSRSSTRCRTSCGGRPRPGKFPLEPKLPGRALASRGRATEAFRRFPTFLAAP